MTRYPGEAKTNGAMMGTVASVVGITCRATPCLTTIPLITTCFAWQWFGPFRIWR